MVRIWIISQQCVAASACFGSNPSVCWAVKLPVHLCLPLPGIGFGGVLCGTECMQHPPQPHGCYGCSPLSCLSVRACVLPGFCPCVLLPGLTPYMPFFWVVLLERSDRVLVCCSTAVRAPPSPGALLLWWMLFGPKLRLVVWVYVICD